jgi:hypothetical protein
MAAGVYTLARAGILDVATGAVAALAGLAFWRRRAPAMAVVLGAGAVAGSLRSDPLRRGVPSRE